MEINELISKKDLLLLTGISYGQLYRWKRENLIPESWFMKQSSYTGQETFFPRDRILKRISLILEYKDKYSLEQLAALIYPDHNKKNFSSAEISKIRGIREGIVSLFEKEKGERYFRFSEIRFMLVLSAIEDELQKLGADISHLIKSMLLWAKMTRNTSSMLLILSKRDILLYILTAHDANTDYDSETRIVASYNIDEILSGFEHRFFEMTGS